MMITDNNDVNYIETDNHLQTKLYFLLKVTANKTTETINTN